MMKKILLGLNIFLLTNLIIFSEIRSQINNEIIVRVGSLMVSSFDVQNEIMTNLVLNKKEISQENINNRKNFAIKNLINKTIKKNEIEKFKIEKYSKADLGKYVKKIAISLGTSESGLKEIFKNYNIDYDVFIENYKTELLWNTLIFRIYKDQISINIIDVKNEVEKFLNTNKVEFNLSEIEISNSQYDKNKLQEILSVIKSEGFNIAAKKFSISSTAKNGGLMGWISQETLSKKYLAEIKKISTKEVSAPILNENSVLILMVNKIRESDNEAKEVDNEVRVDQIKKRVLSKKKQDKLSLFSRSHLSNLENTMQIDFR